MQNLTFLLALFISFLGNTQETASFSFSTPTYQVLYRGIDNYVSLTSCEPSDEYEVQCINCDTLYETSIAHTYVVHPGKGKKAILNVIATNAPTKVLASHQLSVSNLPDPTLYYGATKNAGRASKLSHPIFVTYPPEIHIDAKFEVLSWNMYIGEQVFSGEGNKLTEEASTYLKSRQPKDGFALRVIVQGPDGIKRYIGGAFTL